MNYLHFFNNKTKHIIVISKMSRTFALSFWISSLTVISLSEAGIPLSLRCSSRPFLSTVSRSSAAPFLSAEPHLTFVPILPAPIPDCDVDYIPDFPETTLKTIVILHKVHKNNDNIEIIITNKRKEPKDDHSNESIENDQSDEAEMINDTSMNHYDAKNSSEEKSEGVIPAHGEEPLEQDDEINRNLVKKDTSTVVHAKEEVLSDEESDLNKAEDDDQIMKMTKNITE